MKVKYRAAIAAMILACFILQSTVFQAFAIGSIVPNLLLILTVSFGFMRGKKTGLWIGFLWISAGLLWADLPVYRLCGRMLLQNLLRRGNQSTVADCGGWGFALWHYGLWNSVPYAGQN